MTDDDLIKKVYENDDILQLEDGDYYYWVENKGALSAHNLRVIADELDRRNYVGSSSVYTKPIDTIGGSNDPNCP
jgi:hypothetical protein